MAPTSTGFDAIRDHVNPISETTSRTFSAK
jgi:hypothetical protein